MKHWIHHRLDELPHIEHDPRCRNYAERMMDLITHILEQRRGFCFYEYFCDYRRHLR